MSGTWRRRSSTPGPEAPESPTPASPPVRSPSLADMVEPGGDEPDEVAIAAPTESPPAPPPVTNEPERSHAGQVVADGRLADAAHPRQIAHAQLAAGERLDQPQSRRT